MELRINTNWKDKNVSDLGQIIYSSRFIYFNFLSVSHIDIEFCSSN